ncbi:hypothetical protein IAE22_30505, partial [Bacillus sp. S34]|nr:hypothetical protein [Bacillus sp. S34]
MIVAAGTTLAAVVEQLKVDFPLGYAEPTDGLLAPQAIIKRIGELTGPEG